MTFTPAFNGIVSNGSTPVTVVAAPAERTQRIVRMMIFHNSDTASRTVTVKHVTAAGSSFILLKQLVAPDQDAFLENIILDKTTHSITAELDGAVSTTEWSFTAHLGDLGP